MPPPLEWTALLGLVVAAGGCAGETPPPTPSGGAHTSEPGHPCQGKGACTWYRQLPDGGAVGADEGGDAGALLMCGPCNG